MKTLFNKIKESGMLPMYIMILGGCFLGTFLKWGNYNYVKQEQSEILYKRGKVITTIYNKSYDNEDDEGNLGVGINMKGGIVPAISLGSGVGVDMKGKLVFAPSSSSEEIISETWGVILRDENGRKFPVIGEGEKYEKLWEKLDEGDSVRISYKEIYNVIYNSKTKQSIYKELINYDLIDSEKIGEK